MSDEDRRALALMAKNRRKERRDAGICINGWTHGKATHGVLCAACRAQHNGNSALALELREKFPRAPRLSVLIKAMAETIVINTRRAA